MKRTHPLPVLCALALCCLLVACQTVTEYVIPHPKHAEKGAHEAVTDFFDGLARTQRDIEKAFGKGGSGDKGRIFVHVRGPAWTPTLSGCCAGA